MKKMTSPVLAVLMVRNEGRILRRCIDALEDIADTILVVDTGSTDDTVTVAEDQGCIVRQHVWQDFGHNRSLSFKEAATFAPGWALVVDADMKLVVDAPRLRALLAESTDAGLTILQVNGSLEYRNVRLMRLSDDWKCKGVTHEYWTCRHGTVGEVPRDIAHIDDVGDGGCKADKFERDEHLLSEGLRAEPHNERYYFYMANTLNCQGKTAEACEYYRKRIAAGGWLEEVWYSMYMLAKLVPDFYEAEAWVQRALDVTDRPEALLWLSQKLREDNRHHKAWHYVQVAAAMAPPGENRLFLETDVPDRIDYEKSILQYYVSPDRDEGARLSIKCLGGPYDAQVRANMKFYARKLEGETHILKFPVPEGFVSSSIALDEDGVANVRCVDYHITENGSYEVADGKVRTRNFTSVYAFHARKFIGFAEVVPQQPRTRDCFIQGLEDIRLCCGAFTATTQEWSYCDANRMALGKYPSLEFEVVRAPTERHCEKSWLPLPDGRLIYEWHPLTITSVQDGNLVVDSTHSTPAWWRHLRGSAPPFAVGDKYMALAHLVAETAPRTYLSVLVEIEPSTWRPTAASLPFFFFGDIEYCLSAQCVAGEVHFFVSHWDRESYVVVVKVEGLPQRFSL